MVAASRLIEGRHAGPTVAIIDSQTVKTTEMGGPTGYDAGKKIAGRKRHKVTDTQGNMLDGMVHEASIHDRDGAPDGMRACDLCLRSNVLIRSISGPLPFAFAFELSKELKTAQTLGRPSRITKTMTIHAHDIVEKFHGGLVPFMWHVTC